MLSRRMRGNFMFVFTSMLLGASVMSTATIAIAAEPIDEIQWVYKDKLRLGWTPDRYSQYQVMADAGMNAVMPRLELDVTPDYDPAKFDQPLSGNDAQIMADLLKGSALAKEVGLHYFHCLGIACERQTFEGGAYQNDARFNDDRLPSPLDKVYWKRTITDRVDRALRLLADRDKYQLDAIIIDPEMYAFDGALHSEADYGTFAFNLWQKESGQSAPAGVKDVESRRKWLSDKGLAQQYIDWQFEKVEEIGRELREQVDEVRPDLIIGYVIYEDRMWFNAMAAGMTRDDLPVFIGPESTYSGVMDDSMVDYFNRMQASIKVPCMLVPGLQLGLVKGEPPLKMLSVLKGNLYQRCQHVPGYWVWAIYNLGTDEQQGAFFSMLKEVNDALDRQAATGEVNTALQAGPLPVEVPPYFADMLAKGARMKPLPAGTAMARLPFEAPQLRGTYMLMLWPRQGEREAITVRSIKLGNYLDRTESMLFGHDGTPLYDGPTELGQTRQIQLMDAAAPFSANLMGAGYNSYAIEAVDCPAMIYADGLLEVNAQKGSAGRYYFYVPADRKEFTMKVFATAGEPADYTLFDAAGNKVKVWKDHKELTTETFQVTTPGVWCMQVDYLLDDGGFGLVDLPNFFAIKPEDVHVLNP